MSFSGAKLALFLGDDLVVLRRDDRPDIPFPGLLDLPGGGREGAESPAACALRETEEEVGLQLTSADLVWSRRVLQPHGPVWLFAAHLPAARRTHVRFGQEGQGWMLMDPQLFTAAADAVPHLAAGVAAYLNPGSDRKAPRSDGGGS